MPRTPLKRWPTTPFSNRQYNPVLLCIRMKENIYETGNAYGKRLIQKTQIWGAFDAEPIRLFLTQEAYDTRHGSGLPSYGSRFLAWHVLQVPLFFHCVLVNPSLCFR